MKSEAEKPKRGARKVRNGVVVSDVMDKTVVVKVERSIRHSLYGKSYRRTGNLYVHDEGNEAKTGDKVKVTETRPLSKTKRWRLLEIVERAK